MNAKRTLLSVGVLVLFLTSLPLVSASTKWYVDGVNGNDSNNCLSPTTACKTIGHAISLSSSGDSVSVAEATYTENLTISISLKLIGASPTTTIIDGGAVNTVVSVPNTNTRVTLSKLTIRNGKITTSLFSRRGGGGIFNTGTLTVSNSTITANSVYAGTVVVYGGGVFNSGTLIISNSTLDGNSANAYTFADADGGAVYNAGTLTINGSTVSSNSASCSPIIDSGHAHGGGVYNVGTLTINNSTINGNETRGFPGGTGGGIYSRGSLTINNTTLSGNYSSLFPGDGIDGAASLQNSILASNSGGNCSGTMTSNGYNLSDDNSCSFNGPGDLNNTDPKLGPLQNNGGPTQTQALLSGSPAIDAGNPSGCTDGSGNLLKTDQRGAPRPDREDSGGCDMGAYEKQTDLATFGGPLISIQDEAEVLSDRKILRGLADTITYNGNCEVDGFGKLTGSCLDANVPPYHFCRLGSSASCSRGKRAIHESVVQCSGFPDRVDSARKCSF